MIVETNAIAVTQRAKDAAAKGLFYSSWQAALECDSERAWQAAKTFAAFEAELPDDVRRLVIAAREFWGIHDSPIEPEARELDQALEAFASRVPFADEPA